MKETKDVELRRIDVVSVFRFFGGAFLLVGLVIGLFGNLLRIDLISTGIGRAFPFISSVRPGIAAGMVFAFFYGLCGAVGFSVFALLYNFFAALFGGVKIETKE